MKYLRRGMNTSIRNNSSAYAYSVLITATFGIAQSYGGSASTGHVFAFVVGAALAFAVAEAVVSGFFRNRMRPERSEVVVLGSAFALVSVTGGLGVSTLTAWALTGHWVRWAVTPFTGTIAYLVLSGVEMGLALRAEQKSEDSGGGPDGSEAGGDEE